MSELKSSLVNANALLAAYHDLKLNLTLDEGVQSVVRADSDVSAGMDLGASLSYDDAACLNSLTTELPINFHNAKKEADRNLLPFGYFTAIYRVIRSNYRNISVKISLKQALESLTVSCLVAVILRILSE